MDTSLRHAGAGSTSGTGGSGAADTAGPTRRCLGGKAVAGGAGPCPSRAGSGVIGSTVRIGGGRRNGRPEKVAWTVTGAAVAVSTSV
ncbi:hypothetical protein E2562_004845 [Oryza meyeriana var. granulata]|uniref:Uncharacterized protein n=1 Tax=Oryza meyeriana var. granulata TaxID=110450 RepID=A0A6G1DE43_9ORYZ|nr:hypothetical protein E2562_004845 [Oryza meyeriana var. granulata]